MSEQTHWVGDGCDPPHDEDPSPGPISGVPLNPPERLALAEAFDGVVHNACGPDYWAADHALAALSAAGFRVVPVLDADKETRGRRCGACDGRGFRTDSRYGLPCKACGGSGVPR